jgi:hypothetical protein
MMIHLISDLSTTLLYFFMKKDVPVARLFTENLATQRRRKGLSQGDLAREPG